jgi:DNA-binding MarR family transcriptional regulator
VTATASSTSRTEAASRLLSESTAVFDPFRFRAWAQLGLTTAQLRVLSMVREQPGVTAGELAGRLSVTPPTISGIVDRLVRLGLVRREDDESDRRLVRNHLTERGENACTRLEKGGDIFTKRILEEMNSHDLDSLVTGLTAFIRAAEYAQRAQPDLAAVAMPGTGLG